MGNLPLTATLQSVLSLGPATVLQTEEQNWPILLPTSTETQY